ncbi:unnamed protein product [Linum trigynum]|uniref:Uncharacterized protein n=1 Tax=Linum trigynum TaxID=586398 RepID=A0AAV2FV06_9ROSI
MAIHVEARDRGSHSHAVAGASLFDAATARVLSSLNVVFFAEIAQRKAQMETGTNPPHLHSQSRGAHLLLQYHRAVFCLFLGKENIGALPSRIFSIHGLPSFSWLSSFFSSCDRDLPYKYLPSLFSSVQ